MNKVEFTTNRGRVERLHPKVAELLARKGKGTYRTTDVGAAPLNTAMRAHIPPSVETDSEPAPVFDTPSVEQTGTAPSEPAATPGSIDLASMSVEQLREHAKKQGVQVHHRAGATTILKALQDGGSE